MAKFNFSEVFDQLKVEALSLAQNSIKEFGRKAKHDAEALLNGMEDKLKRWSLLLANEDLTPEDFEWLVNSQKDLVEMSGLKEAGLAAIRIEEFKNSLLNLVVSTITSVVKG